MFAYVPLTPVHLIGGGVNKNITKTKIKIDSGEIREKLSI